MTSTEPVPYQFGATARLDGPVVNPTRLTIHPSLAHARASIMAYCPTAPKSGGSQSQI